MRLLALNVGMPAVERAADVAAAMLAAAPLAGAVTDAFILQAPREAGLTAHAAVVVDLDLQLRP
jgi:hypothetical protein